MEEKDILELEKRYWFLKGSSPTGKLDPDTLVPMISPPLPPMLAKGVFNAFDENRDNHIDFKVLAFIILYILFILSIILTAKCILFFLITECRKLGK